MVSWPLLIGERATVELGCGRKKVDINSRVVIGVDRHDFDGVDIVWDLEVTPWDTWAHDESCALVISHQTLEHIRDLIPVMNEIWRICDDDAYVEIVVPYGTSQGALQDPTHVRFFTEVTWRYWEPGFVGAFSDYGIEGYFGICETGWLADGNLWVLLRPLKTDDDLEAWRMLRESDPWPRMEAPHWLAARGAMLLGELEEPDGE
jgi:hypothetical protein